jgi:GT2 family glycosyltransferase
VSDAPAGAWWVVVLSWNGREDTLACLASLEGLGVPVACVDNGSVDGTVEAVRERFPWVSVIENGANLGFSGGNNAGIRHALSRGAEWVVLLNNDATLEAGALEALASAAAARPSAGVLGGKVLFADGSRTIWFAGQRFHALLGYSGRPRGYGKPDGPSFSGVFATDRAVGAFMAVSRSAIDAAGLLDEDLFAYVEDVDWCQRVRDAGFEVLIVGDAAALHRVSASTGGAAGSMHALYYGARNTLVVCERRRPLPRAGALLRRAVIAATFGLHALTRGGDRRASLAAVREGLRDARAGRLGERG